MGKGSLPMHEICSVLSLLEMIPSLIMHILNSYPDSLLPFPNRSFSTIALQIG